MKKVYEQPLIEVIELEKRDIIVMSEDSGDIDFGDLVSAKVVD